MLLMLQFIDFASHVFDGLVVWCQVAECLSEPALPAVVRVSVTVCWEVAKGRRQMVASCLLTVFTG